ncbi:hypothetical protein C8N40_101504 [Pontibacter mucosus]|uniref:Uncharacterized protein n=1 Tax=Pontibacter mucosus TaxID=1649266 RepID=A0A2T5YTN0_9BACT|nr:hypothetical protein [Pontibacter mucosus]PTX22677.1 hypothetical protein C8N40_101504 [Pontibacter mucosus]
MTNIERFSSSPQKLGTALTKLFFEKSNLDNNAVELEISIDSGNLSVREFSSYLDIIYRIDGMTSELGYNRYVQIPEAQIQISEIRFGSVLIVIERLLQNLDATNIVIIWISLKLLPKVINATTQSGIQIFEMLNKREEYLEKRDRRKFRKKIRDSINEDNELQEIDKNLKEKLVDLLDEIYFKNSQRIGPASRFADKSVKSVQIKTKRKNNNR